MDDFVKKLIELGTDYGLRLIAAILVLVIGLKLAKWACKLISRGKGFKKLDVTVQSFLNSFIRITLKTIVFVSAAIVLGIPATTFVTIMASCGLAIGLAVQGALGNLAGGLMILVFKPFGVGDYITTCGESGTVASISVFYTVLKTIDNKRITVPNGKVMSDAVTDYSAEQLRRVDLTYSASYSDDVELVKSVLIKTAEENEKVLRDPAPFARMIKHGESSLDYILRVWCKADDYWDVLFDMNENVKKAFDANGIEIPFRQVEMRSRTN